MIALAEIQRQDREGAGAQDSLNADYANGSISKDDIVYVAEIQHAAHAQYQGHWDGDEWEVVVFVADVATKAGGAFVAGDIAIAKPDGARGWVAYSVRNRIDTLVQASHIERLDVAEQPAADPGALQALQAVNPDGPDEYNSDYDLVGNSCWVRVGHLVLYILDTGKGAAIDVMHNDDADGEPVDTLYYEIG